MELITSLCDMLDVDMEVITTSNKFTIIYNSNIIYAEITSKENTKIQIRRIWDGEKTYPFSAKQISLEERNDIIRNMSKELSQAQISKMIGVSQPTVSNVLRQIS